MQGPVNLFWNRLSLSNFWEYCCMDIRFIDAAIEDMPCDALVVGAAYQNTLAKEKQLALTPAAQEVDSALDGMLQALYAEGEFKAEVGELATIHTMNKLAARRIIITGLGALDKLGIQQVQRAYGAAARQAQATGARAMALACETGLASQESEAQAAIEGALLGLYTFKKYQQANGNGHGIDTIRIIAPPARYAQLEPALERAQTLAEATNFARDLVNEPPNVLTPTELANRASLIARQYGLESEILDRPQMQELGMGGLLAVSQGSAEPAKFIILRYRGAPERRGTDLALVGKGITFDTGGISLKPAERMHEMKGDMAGAAAVMGAMYAAAMLRPAINVTALVPATENMPGGTAYRPGDILRIMNGKTIEIVNTDAEGRLVLADALSYAVLKERAPAIIDVATLTGGIVVALGSVMSGMFCNDDALSALISAAGRAAGEKFWRMPLDEEYAEAIASDVADIKQTGGRPASPVTAAKILENFVAETPWAHLDIAGMDFTDTKKPYQEKGATGFAVRTLAELILMKAN
jgi:leucyl aminopeptidase